MRIAEVAPLWKKVPPQKYGGLELAVSNITEGLIRKGHDVTLFACGGSKTKGSLIEVIPKPMHELSGGFFWNAISPYEFLEYYDLAEKIRNREFDLIHNHIGFQLLAFSPLIDVPIATTLHSSLKPDFPYLAERFKNQNYVSVSNAQRELAPYLNYVETIYHGIQSSEYEPRLSGDSDYYLFLGSLSRNKGVDIAVRAAKELGIKLFLAGESRETEKDFYEKEVNPYVDGKQIRVLGEVTAREKNRLLRGAKALLFPSQWKEAFGLVMIEALAYGTPVVAYGNGSVPEIIIEGETGYIVDNYHDFKSKISEVGGLSRKSCRKEAEVRFDVSVMVNNYLSLFEELVKGGI